MAAEFIHRLVPGSRPITLLALHGAGGDENDLVQVCRVIVPGAAVLSPRLAPDAGPEALAEWLGAGLHAPLYAFAYGEGADLAAAILLSHPGLISGAVLLRPTGAARPQLLPNLQNTPVLIAAGSEAESLGRLLSEAGASVDFAFAETGRDLGPQDFAMAKRWFAQVCPAN